MWKDFVELFSFHFIMSIFVCPICLNDRKFETSLKFFRHITLFHQNESKFQITCNLSSFCGISYNTYAGYKSHIYRHHFDQLRVLNNKIDVFEMSFVNNIPLTDPKNDDNVDYQVNDPDNFNASNEDEDHIDPINLFDLISDQSVDYVSVLDIKKSFALFLLQLREDFLLPKKAINSISTYIVTLMTHLQSLFEHQMIHNDLNATGGNPFLKPIPISKTKYVDIDTIRAIINEVSYGIEAVSRNEYQFHHFCEKYFFYRPPNEIILSSPGEPTQVAYFIPIDQTIKLILHNDYVINEIFDNIKQQREKVLTDNDLMFSFRDGHFGHRIDDESLLIQLYIDDIGLTNPIGAKKDKHKMSMVYFSLEDIPDQYRSQLEHIHLVGICTSQIFKVKLYFDYIRNTIN